MHDPKFKTMLLGAADTWDELAYRYDNLGLGGAPILTSWADDNKGRLGVPRYALSQMVCTSPTS
jgi:hypothetical protein